MEIVLYTKKHEKKLFEIIKAESEWETYSETNGWKKYKKALLKSVTFLAYEGKELCGFIRCREDFGFGVYIYDLLVKPACRGRSIGRKLMEHICSLYPDETVYVMSDVDKYYEKLGYKKEGSVFIVEQE